MGSGVSLHFLGFPAVNHTILSTGSEEHFLVFSHGDAAHGVVMLVQGGDQSPLWTELLHLRARSLEIVVPHELCIPCTDIDGRCSREQIVEARNLTWLRNLVAQLLNLQSPFVSEALVLDHRE